MLNLYHYYDKPDELNKHGTVVFIDDVVNTIKHMIDNINQRHDDNLVIDSIRQHDNVYTIRVKSKNTTKLIMVMDKNNEILVSGSDMDFQVVATHSILDKDQLQEILDDILIDWGQYHD